MSDYAELIRRVFAVAVLECPRCHGPMKIRTAIHPPEMAGAILECLGLPARPPPVAPAHRAAAPLSEADPGWFRDGGPASRQEGCAGIRCLGRPSAPDRFARPFPPADSPTAACQPPVLPAGATLSTRWNAVKSPYPRFHSLDITPAIGAPIGTGVVGYAIVSKTPVRRQRADHE